MAERREWTVSGMDCAACTAKVTQAVAGLPGVSEVSVALMAERLTARLEAGARPEAVEAAVRRLGYAIAPRDAASGPAAGQGHARDHAHDHAHAGPGLAPRWHATASGRLVILTGALLVLAWAVEWLAPGRIGFWAFVAACVIGVAPVARRAWAAARIGQPFTIESLLSIAAAGALVIGAVEEAALVVFLFAVGEVLEGVAANRARDGIRALGALVPRSALREEAGGGTREVPAEALVIGDVVLVRPGERLPADGVIVEGTGGIDESPVTGESVPVSRGPGDAVFAGAISAESALRIRVTREASDNTIARIIRLVEEAEESRAPTERFITRFSRWYMPLVVGLAALVIVLPPLAFGQDWGTWTYRGLAILLIGCPCALVISVPAAIASALTAGARHGLLMKGGAVIEAVAGLRVAALDKTGTLTEGRPEVTDILPLADLDEAALLAQAAAVEAASSHPLARAILRRAEGLALPVAAEARAVPGRGVEAVVEGRRLTVASPQQALDEGVLGGDARRAAARLEEAGKTVAVLYDASRALGLIALRDQPRADAAAAVAQLRALGVRPVMLTGDNPRTAEAIAGALGMEFRAGMLPEDKLTAICWLAREGVLMVGDGINDAPALRRATVGVAMGSGTDVALETADAAILRDRVTDVPAMIRLARACMSNIRQNIGIALGLKAVFLVTSVLGITGLWIAIMADTGATVLVTLNALRLLRLDPAVRAAASSGPGCGDRPQPLEGT